MNMQKTSDHVLSPQTTADDTTPAAPSVRPKQFDDFIGQTRVREQLHLFVRAAAGRKEALDHVLIYGPPGLGKTTLAQIIASEMGSNIKHTSGPILERQGDLAALLTQLEAHDVLFIDEIHRLSPVVEEILYPAMEDYAIDILIGEGPAAQSVKIDLPPFTLIGATTRAGLLTSPLRDRFGIVERLVFYDTQELTAIILRAADLSAVHITETGAQEIARRSRGTPRIAGRLLRRVRDIAEVRFDGTITTEVAAVALDMLEVDTLGLDHMDLHVLRTVIEKFSGGPVGVDSLAIAAGEERGTLEDVVEPYLVQQGLMQRTRQGRIATPKTYEHLHITPPKQKKSLFHS